MVLELDYHNANTLQAEKLYLIVNNIPADKLLKCGT